MPPAARSRIVGLVLIAASVICLAVPASWLPGLRMAALSAIEPVLTRLAGAPGGRPSPDDPRELKALVESLRKEQAKLREKLIESEDRCYQLARQIADIKEFREIAPKVIEPNEDLVIPARVIGRSTNWESLTITVNRGAADGVRAGLGVTSGQSVVGVVTEVGASSARVALLPERGVKIPAAILGAREAADGREAIESRRQGLIVGDGARVMMKYVHSIEHVPGGQVRPGDRIITTGLAGMFRSGWLIGVVANVGPAAEEPFPNIEVSPVLNFSDIELVMIIKVPRRPLSGE